MSNRLSFFFGLMCALDPCQLVWERYVMTETFSLLVYVLVLYWSLAYLRDRRLWQLGLLIDRWREIENDPRKNDRVARETAINALRHRPLEIVGLAVEIYMGYWNPGSHSVVRQNRSRVCQDER
jgi:hypothetical protein